MKLRALFAILFFLLLAAMLLLTYWPDLPDAKVKVRDEWFRLDYVGHFGFYAAISSTFLLWRKGWGAKIPLKLLFLTFIAGLALGITTEYTQQLSSGRSFNPFDMMYNCVGIAGGIMSVVILGKTAERYNN